MDRVRHMMSFRRAAGRTGNSPANALPPGLLLAGQTLVRSSDGIWCWTLHDPALRQAGQHAWRTGQSPRLRGAGKLAEARTAHEH